MKKVRKSIDNAPTSFEGTKMDVITSEEEDDEMNSSMLINSFASNKGPSGRTSIRAGLQQTNEIFSPQRPKSNSRLNSSINQDSKRNKDRNNNNYKNS